MMELMDKRQKREEERGKKEEEREKMMSELTQERRRTNDLLQGLFGMLQNHLGQQDD